MTPQALEVLLHLRRLGTITRVEAENVYRIRHLPGTIFRLRTAGYVITAEQKRDLTGQRYVRYRLVAEDTAGV